MNKKNARCVWKKEVEKSVSRNGGKDLLYHLTSKQKLIQGEGGKKKRGAAKEKRGEKGGIGALNFLRVVNI